MRFLNHGSFGACTRPVLERQAELRGQLERDPAWFLTFEAPRLLQSSRARLAEFLGVSPDDIAFVDNATTAVNCVLASFGLAAGDEVLITDHGYRACNNAAREWAARAGARVTVARLPFPVQEPGQLVEAVVNACTPRTRLAIIDHVTSPTALVLPVEAIVCELRARGVRTLVDGAHAPGMLPLALATINADYYTGNAHKWLCAPKGSAFLFVRRDLQCTTRPLVISHAASMLGSGDPGRFQAEFGWTGTNDPTAWICVGDAIEQGSTQTSGGWIPRMARNRAMVLEARRVVCERLDVAPPCPASMVGSMASIELPDGLAPPPDPHVELDPLQAMLRRDHAIDVPIIAWPSPPRRLVRVSTQLYNTPEDYVALADALAAAR